MDDIIVQLAATRVSSKKNFFLLPEGATLRVSMSLLMGEAFRNELLTGEAICSEMASDAACAGSQEEREEAIIAQLGALCITEPATAQLRLFLAPEGTVRESMATRSG